MACEPNGPFKACWVLTITRFIVVVLVAGGDRWISLTTAVDGARVLAIETIPGKSHWNFMSAVLRSLTDAGHAVTVFTQFPEEERENYTVVDTSAEFPNLIDLDLTYFHRIFSSPFRFIECLNKRYRNYCDMVYSNRVLDELIRNAAVTGGTKDFDVIVIEAVMYDCMSYLSSMLDLPIIYTIPSPMISVAERAILGYQSNPAVVPHLFTGYAVLNAFQHRFYNTVLSAYGLLLTAFHKQISRFTDPRPYDSSPTVSPSVIFQNSHHVTEASSSVVPNLIHVGGIHLKPAQSIPKHILDFIENSQHGVIYFTFGSTINLSTLPERVKNVFIEVLARVPQNVLWKYGGEMANKPKNIMTSKWFPQRDILLHPKIKLFISHGGMSGVYESLDAGVPVLGFPLGYDQPRNIEHLVHNEMAISMDLFTITEDQLSMAVSELVNNEKYMKNAKIASARFKDRPMTPQQSVVYWTEYAIRHRGASNSKFAGLELTWCQYYLLDVIAAMLIVLCIVHRVSKVILRFIFK